MYYALMILLAQIPALVGVCVFALTRSLKSVKDAQGTTNKPNKIRFIPLLIGVGFSVFLTWLMAFIGMPAVNVHSGMFWLTLIVGMPPNIVALFFWCSADIVPICGFNTLEDKGGKAARIASIAIYLAAIIIPVIALIASTALFHAKDYASILAVEEGTVEDLPDAEDTGSIALMDTESAEVLGDREIGSMDDTIVSQFDVGDYMQLNVNGAPTKIAELRYGSVFKWARTNGSGVPGYISVDPVKMTAQYITFDKPLVYTTGDYFGKNLNRRIRSAYPSVLFENTHLELDEDGAPYYVSSVFDYSIGFFGGKTVTGAIITDPITGEMKKYDLKDIPQWVDFVISGELLCDQYDWFGSLSNGFMNSIFGQKGCRKTTDVVTVDSEGYEHDINDYGYLALDSDVWIYTGVTSVASDSSNLGFLIANERTGEARYITCAGADENSAMAAAEGEVQEKGYKSSFPSLVRINDAPVYIMVLKDDNALVKMYAIVDVQQYNTVAVADTLHDCIDKYNKLIGNDTAAVETETGTETDSAETTVDLSDGEEKTITIRAMQTIVENGTTYLYVMDEDRAIYYSKYVDNLGMMDKQVGDKVTIRTNGTVFELAEDKTE